MSWFQRTLLITKSQKEEEPRLLANFTASNSDIVADLGSITPLERNQSKDSEAAASGFAHNWYTLLLDEPYLNFWQKFPREFDELPSKLEAIENSLATAPLNVSFDKIQWQTLSSSPKEKNKLKLSRSKKGSIESLEVTRFVGLKLKTIISESKIDPKILLSSVESVNKKDFLDSDVTLQKEFRKIFTASELEELSQIEFDAFNETRPYLACVAGNDSFAALEGEFVKPRLMSGYRYPDMDLREVISFLWQREFSDKTDLALELPPNYLLPRVQQFQHSDPPIFELQTQKIVLRALDENQKEKIIYRGPAVVLNSQSGLEWVTQTNNEKQTLRSWLEKYLGPTNPTRETLKNYFGSLQPLSEKSEPLPFQRSVYVPKMSVKDWTVFQEKYKQQQIQNAIQTAKRPEEIELLKQVEFLTVPAFEARIPKVEPENFRFGTNPFVEFQYLHPTLQQDSSSYPKISPSLSFGLTNANTLSSGTYQKYPLLVDQNNQVFFSDQWEPLTTESWLIVSKLGFGLFFFSVLKTLASNYGRELLEYLLDLVASLGFLDENLKQEIEILMGKREKGFRIISKTTQNFSNIAGIQNLLPEIIEIVWFLRNSGREFALSKTLPRGVLLTGPPGTGKTILVQAIAGEAEVPVVALSGSSLLEPGESGAIKLQILFDEARKMAPCIVFIDEVDTLAQKREHMGHTSTGAEDLLDTLSNPLSNVSHSGQVKATESEDPNAVLVQEELRKEKLRLLLQFLVELDGIKSRTGVVVIAATNRPEMLDPAVLRPGRFDRIIDLGLPGPEKRNEIFKLYSTNLGVNDEVSWDYFTHRTAGYSAADIASIMNQSTLYAILNQSRHTLETIEYGIDRITTLEKPMQVQKDTVFALQLAYYQAGKILLSRLLKHHPPTLVAHLWPRRPNARALQISENLQNYVFRFARRVELEHRLIGCYAGKAAEILFLQQGNAFLNVSDLGLEDLHFAQNLITLMVENWTFYSTTSLIHQNSEIITGFNEKEYRYEFAEKLPFFQTLLDPIQTTELSVIHRDEQVGNLNYYYEDVEEEEDQDLIEQQAQKYFQVPSWQSRISNEFEFATRTFSNWYRLYLPDPLQKERNLEWIPPDEFYHGNIFAKKLSESLTLNEVANIHIDYQTHSLILQSFNKALVLLHENRDVLDTLAYELLACEVLHQSQIDHIVKDLVVSDVSKSDTTEPDSEIEVKKIQEKLLSKNWGPNSRRPQSRWLNLDMPQSDPEDLNVSQSDLEDLS
uniref:Cell division protein n=1 Tax=Marvania geminata TaxID=97105 RepID=A0A097KR67_9CHLO|nr:cell division protein [Marvania geminata]AIT95654.1 cell division protein [Marvania geminata]